MLFAEGSNKPLGRNSLTNATRVTMTVLKDLLRSNPLKMWAKTSIDPGDLKERSLRFQDLLLSQADSVSARSETANPDCHRK